MQAWLSMRSLASLARDATAGLFGVAVTGWALGSVLGAALVFCAVLFTGLVWACAHLLSKDSERRRR